MLNKPRIREIYAKIQKQLFYMIPEKWSKIYLYACFIENSNQEEKGEMFFYYYPKGILKKEPINVYEVPAKFNIDEEGYNNLANNLYETIRLLREEFKKNEEKLWSNLTISIANARFNVEYNYERLNQSNYSSYDRHMIWKYKYLDFPIERMNKRDRQMLKEYLLEEEFRDIEVKRYTEGMYQNKVHNIVEYNKEERIEEYDLNKRVEENELKTGRKVDKYQLYKEEQNRKNKQEEIKSKNQILNL